ncbi:MAG: hypothetical protein FWJ65_11200 [Limnochordales bacterium]
MSRLMNMGKKEKEPVVQKTVRIPAELYNKFEKIFDKLNLSFNEAVNYLIEAEVEEVEKEKYRRKMKGSSNTEKKDEKK